MKFKGAHISKTVKSYMPTLGKAFMEELNISMYNCMNLGGRGIGAHASLTKPLLSHHSLCLLTACLLPSWSSPCFHSKCMQVTERTDSIIDTPLAALCGLGYAYLGKG